MSWWNDLGNTVESWFGKKPTASSTPTSSTTPMTPQQWAQPINNEKTQLENALQGNFKKGGKVKKTGIYRLHKGEEVIPKKKAEIARRMGRVELTPKNRRALSKGYYYK